MLAAFEAAATAAVDAMAEPAVTEQWAAPSVLDGMTVGAVAAHLDVNIERLEVLLSEPEPTDGPVVALAEFYGANRIEGSATASDDRLHAFIRDDAARRAAAGPEAVGATLAARVRRLLAVVPTVAGDRLVPTARVPGGRARFDDYLATRVVELAVHTDDLLASVGIDRAPRPEVTDVVLGVATRLARARHGDLAVVRAAFRGERAAPVLPVL